MTSQPIDRIRRRDPRYAGEIAEEGELTHVWVFAFDPRWREICKAEFMAERPGNPKKKWPRAMVSQHAPGKGRWFLSRYVDGFQLIPDQRLQMAAIASSIDAILRRTVVIPGARKERAYPENYQPGPKAHPKSRYLSADEQRLLLTMSPAQRLSWIDELAIPEAKP